jgi:hypothetical protein
MRYAQAGDTILPLVGWKASAWLSKATSSIAKQTLKKRIVEV